MSKKLVIVIAMLLTANCFAYETPTVDIEMNSGEYVYPQLYTSVQNTMTVNITGSGAFVDVYYLINTTDNDEDAHTIQYEGYVNALLERSETQQAYFLNWEVTPGTHQVPIPVSGLPTYLYSIVIIFVEPGGNFRNSADIIAKTKISAIVLNNAGIDSFTTNKETYTKDEKLTLSLTLSEELRVDVYLKINKFNDDGTSTSYYVNPDLSTTLASQDEEIALASNITLSPDSYTLEFMLDTISTGDYSFEITMTPPGLPSYKNLNASCNFSVIDTPEEIHDMVLLSGGTFTMGVDSSNTSLSMNDNAAHQVTVSDFSICKYEVTVQQYCNFLNDGNSVFYSETSRYYPISKDVDGFCSPKEGKANQPMTFVSYSSADYYCYWLSQKTGEKYRLPTEAEWEYACRAGTTTNYSWGNEADTSLANMNAANADVLDIGSYAANPWGIFDMHGNVSEWCSDYYGSTYYSSSPTDNPQGPGSGTERVVRGGSFILASEYAASGFRWSSNPTYESGNVGFRVVKEVSN